MWGFIRIILSLHTITEFKNQITLVENNHWNLYIHGMDAITLFNIKILQFRNGTKSNLLFTHWSPYKTAVWFHCWFLSQPKLDPVTVASLSLCTHLVFGGGFYNHAYLHISPVVICSLGRRNPYTAFAEHNSIICWYTTPYQ